MKNIYEALAADTQFGFINRAVAAQQANNPRLIVNDDRGTMLREIKLELKRSHSFVFSVAFVTSGALGLLKQDLLDFPGRGVLITSTYLDFNEPAMFRELLNLPNVDVYVASERDAAFHAKGYVFKQYPATTAIVGSSNFTRQALLTNNEWNIRFSAMPDGDIVRQVEEAVEEQIDSGIRLTSEWIDAYEARRQPMISREEREAGADLLLPQGKILPNAMQLEALEALDAVRDAGEKRALVVSATGTGKTILAALAARSMDPRRLLFLAHREQILDKASQEFERVLNVPRDRFGRVSGRNRELDRDYIFATVQTFSRDDTLKWIAPARFDLIIVDEVHRAGASSYRKILSHFMPNFLLGLTATPERSDDFNIFELFDHNVPYEIRLQEALDANMLAPFNYYGVTEYTDEQGGTIEETSRLSALTAEARVDHIVSALEKYGHSQGVKGLMFCSRNAEARELQRLLNARSANGRPLKTLALSGADSVEAREAAVRDLEGGYLDYLLTVDIFNEGIDIPQVNQVVMLRGTQSSIVFTQQLGRGLRKAVGKDHLRVIDFIGNYANNFMIPIALFGDSSLNRDVIRKRMIEAQESGTVAGVSSINFEEIARRRVLESLAATKLDSIPALKRALIEMERRLGGIPALLDFARFDDVDPVLISTKTKGRSYWDFLASMKKVSMWPDEEERRYLAFLSLEVLNGKRPHELVALRSMLESSNYSVYRQGLAEDLSRLGVECDDETFGSIARVLALEFSTQQERDRYGEVGVATREGDELRLTSSFVSALRKGAYFRRHVDDIVETGLYVSRHRFGYSGELKVGERYSRKDVCRLLNWRSNMQGVMYGYKIDESTNSCPIFITYHKAEDVSDSTAYEDRFVSPRTIRWFTRSRLTLDSNEVKRILDPANPPRLHIFVKKDDAESGDFYYLGLADAADPRQEKMPSKQGEPLNVVAMDLNLRTPVEAGVYDYFTAGEMVESSALRSLPSDWVSTLGD